MIKWKRSSGAQQPSSTTQSPQDALTPAWPEVKPCHKNPTILDFPGVPGKLLLGKASHYDAFVKAGVNTFYPLDDLSGRVWDSGFRGTIRYYPIADYCALPADVYQRVVEDILFDLTKGYNAGVCCTGGHGRTGYVAAGVIGKLLPVDDPVKYLRKNYCDHAVESQDQLDSIATYLDRPQIAQDNKPTKGWGWGWGWGYEWDYPQRSIGFKALPKQTTCRACCYYYTEKGRPVCALGMSLNPTEPCLEFEEYRGW